MFRPFFLRRTKAQVLTHLPPMAEVIVPVSMSALQRKLYKSILSKDASLIRAILYKGDKLKNTERARLNNLLMQLRKCVGHPYLYNEDIEEINEGDSMELIHRNLVEAGSKLELLNIMLPKLKERGHRVLMFSQFLGILDIIEDFLNGLGVKFHRLDGSISTLEKQKRIDEFNAPSSDYFAFLLSTRAGGVGINLATADTVIILDPDFNPHQDIQALSRAHRIGQKNKVLVFHLMTRDTVEEKIMQIGKKKLSLDHLIIERMGGEDGQEEEIIDVESILSFGAKRLFDDEDEERTIKYDDESVDKLLDRSQMEQTKTTGGDGDGSAENAFSFARVWANNKGILEETAFAEETGEDDNTPEPGFWDRVLKEREEKARREAAAKLEELGRGRRRRTINYALADNDVADKNDGNSDTDYRADEKNASAEDSDHEREAGIMDGDDLMLIDKLVNATYNHLNIRYNPRPFHQPMLVRPAPGIAPTTPMTGTMSQLYTPNAPPPGITPQHKLNKPLPGDFKRVELVAPTDNEALPRCKACSHRHVPGSCPLKLSGVEFCPMCNIAHLPKTNACPHFRSEEQLDMMLASLRNSDEPKEIVDEAKRLVRERRELVQRKKREQKTREKHEKSATTDGT
jgi:chromodomain-helicase-DNA-binding protein 4